MIPMDRLYLIISIENNFPIEMSVSSSVCDHARGILFFAIGDGDEM